MGVAHGKVRLVALDCETTGLDVESDRIVEIALVEYPDTVLVNTRFRPDVPMSAGATKITGILDEDLAQFQPFEAWAARIQEAIEGAVLMGYGSRRFDTLILDAELRRAGQAGIDLATVQEIDLYRVWQEHEGRSLSGALLRFCDLDHTDDAHGALADVRHLFDLSRAMSEAFGLDMDKMVAASMPDDEVDRSGRLRKNEDGVVVFNCTKHKDAPVTDHVGLIHWMLEKDFPADTKQKLREILQEMQEEQLAKA